jgi:hypothetical protein
LLQAAAELILQVQELQETREELAAAAAVAL